MISLSHLVCGVPSGNGDLAICLKHLGSDFVDSRRLSGSARARVRTVDRLLSPFLARSVLEVACTSIIARWDPFRVLALAKIQSQGAYDPSRKVGSAIQWSGDVLAKSPGGPNLWDTEKKPDSFDRALLSDHQGEILWQPAFAMLLDHLAGYSGASQSLQDLVNIEPRAIVPRLRGTAGRLYSRASKGIHHEFVLSLSSYYDDATLAELANETLWVAATMGLIINFSENAAFRITHNRAVTIYEELGL